MKICFFMNTPFSLGGEQRVTTEIANYLYSQGIEVTFLLLDKSGKINRKNYNLKENINVKFINDYGRKKLVFKRQIKKIINKLNYTTGCFSNNLNILKSIYLNEKEIDILVSEVKKMKCDYVIGVGLRYTVMLSIIKKFLPNTRVVGWQHSTFEAYFETKKTRLYNSEKLAKYMFENLDGYIVQTEYDKSKIKEKFNYDSIVLNNPNSILHISAIDCDKKDNFFISTGRFVKIKNFDKIIKAFAEFLKSSKDWRLILIGDGPEKKNCEKIAKKLGIKDYIDFTGKVFDIEKYYKKSKIYICASEFEGWGMSITEAMMYKNAIISYEFPSVKEIFGNDSCGIILKENTVENLYNVMVELALKTSKDTFRCITDYAYKHVQKYDIKIIGKKWIDFLDEGEKNEK